MSEKEKKEFLKRVKLNYMPATSSTPPKNRIPVSSAHIEDLDREIREKTKQNNMPQSDFEKYM